MVDMSSPWYIAKSGTEHAEQAALFAWANRTARIGTSHTENEERWGGAVSKLVMLCALSNDSYALHQLRWMHAIPNGGAREKASAGNMKAEGVKSGVADIFLPYAVPDRNFVTQHGLYVEMKRLNGKPSDLTDNQIAFREWTLEAGYAWCWAKGWLDARDKIVKYLARQWHSSMGEIY